MLTNRCQCCDTILNEYENKWDDLIQDYNDLCSKCLKTARDMRKPEEEYTVNPMGDSVHDNNME